tara:strand:- start:134 stop:448 length:315 start_codon:yes stop_codon:yes gene_type:complete
MSISSVKETFAQAKKMGLELSSDGKSWVPVEELVVKLPPEKHKQVRISVNKNKGDSTWLQWIFQIGIVALLLVIIGTFIAARLIYEMVIFFMLFISSLGGSAFG